MDMQLLKEIYQEYREKYDDIIEQYGKKDGFIVNNQLWWDFYREQIKLILRKIEKNEITLNDASDFYKIFGFGPKLFHEIFFLAGQCLDRQSGDQLCPDEFCVEYGRGSIGWRGGANCPAV